MRYSVREVTDRKGMKDFLQLPFSIYQHDPSWVAPVVSEVRRVLGVKRNPYFANASLKLLVCYADERPVARLAIIMNRQHWQVFCEKLAFFGFFESTDDNKAIECLFSAAEDYCTVQGADAIEGPFNPNHYSELGLQTSHFGDAPSFFQSYNPGYYLRLLSHVGFQVHKRIHTRKNRNISAYVLQRFGPHRSSILPSGYVVRSLRMNDFNAELERIREVFNDAFSSNWHFLSLTREEYLFSAKFLNLVTFPDLITIVEHNGRPVGVVQCVLDINPLLRQLHGRVGPIGYWRFLRGRSSIRDLIIYAVGIKKAYQRTRVFKLMLDAMCQQALKFESLETTWMSDDNILALRAAQYFGLERDREFAIYRKVISPIQSDKLLTEF